MRSPVAVRPARPEDLDAIVDLCLAARAESVVGSQLCTDDTVRLRHQVAAVVSERGAWATVGTLDDEVCGLILARVCGPSLFADEVCVAIEAVYVGDRARRRGVGHALLAALAAEAQRVGASDVIAVPLPGARGMQRFLARLGFAPAAAHRVVSTDSLQRRLAADSGTATRRAAGRAGIDDLIARRRRARATRAAGSVDPVARATGTETAQAPAVSISMQVSRAVQTRRPRGSSTTTS